MSVYLYNRYLIHVQYNFMSLLCVTSTFVSTDVVKLFLEPPTLAEVGHSTLSYWNGRLPTMLLPSSRHKQRSLTRQPDYDDDCCSTDTRRSRKLSVSVVMFTRFESNSSNPASSKFSICQIVVVYFRYPISNQCCCNDRSIKGGHRQPNPNAHTKTQISFSVCLRALICCENMHKLRCQ